MADEQITAPHHQSDQVPLESHLYYLKDELQNDINIYNSFLIILYGWY